MILLCEGTRAQGCQIDSFHAKFQSCQIGLFDAKFQKFGFFRDRWRKKLSGFFSSLFGFLEGSWHMISDWCLGFAEKCYLAFLDSAWCQSDILHKKYAEKTDD